MFANPFEMESYNGEAKGIICFGSVIYQPENLPNNQIRIPNDATVYLALDAVIRAKLLINKAENVRILGRIILDYPIRGIEITDSRNILGRWHNGD